MHESLNIPNNEYSHKVLEFLSVQCENDSGIEISVPLSMPRYWPRGVHIMEIKSVKSELPTCLVILLLLSTIGVFHATAQTGRPGDGFQLSLRAGDYDASIGLVRDAIARDLAIGVGSSSVAIMDGGRIVYSEGFGKANREGDIAADRTTLFNIGSISKVFTSAALMLLVDDGLLKLDDKVVKHLPEFAMEDPRHRDITLRMLLNHSSGLPGSTLANSFGSERNPEFHEQLLSTLRRSRLRADPGKFASYCNDGFSLAELVVGRVSGKPYGEFLRTRLLAPLGLEKTGLSVGLRPGETSAAYYRPRDGIKDALEVVSATGAGGLASTAEDLCRFADSFSQGGTRILSQTSLREMTKSQPSLAAAAADRNPEMPFGLGWDVALPSFYADKGIQVFWKGGDTYHYHALLLTSPEHRLSLAILQSGQGTGLIRLAKELFESLLAEKGIAVARPSLAPAPTANLPVPEVFRDFEGYYGPSLFRLVLSPEGDSFIQYMSVGSQELPVLTMHYANGHFEDGQGGRYFLARLGGRQYLAGSMFDDCIRMLIGQKLPDKAVTQALRTNIDGKVWLKRSVKPFVTSDDSATHILVSSLAKALPGYVDFAGIKEITAPDHAGMTIEAIAEQKELLLVEKEDRDWAWLAEDLYSPADSASALAAGANTVRIGQKGLSEWRLASAERLLRISLPASGRLIVFSADRSVIHDSAFDSPNTGSFTHMVELRVPAGGFVELAGNPQDLFSIFAE